MKAGERAWRAEGGVQLNYLTQKSCIQKHSLIRVNEVPQGLLNNLKLKVLGN